VALSQQTMLRRKDEPPHGESARSLLTVAKSVNKKEQLVIVDTAIANKL
jgi:hypothetical protein